MNCLVSVYEDAAELLRMYPIRLVTLQGVPRDNLYPLFAL